MGINGQLHAPDVLIPGKGAQDIPLIGDLDMVAKGKTIVPAKSLSIFYFFIFFLSLMS
jgi:hypothetical protein